MASSSSTSHGGVTRKKARRGSRSDTSCPTHHGPVASTSGGSALVQAYLSVDANTNAGNNGVKAAAAEGECVLHMSESMFDRAKRRFGGKSKAVGLATAHNDDDERAPRRGSRLAFGPNARVVATREVMNDNLHCRCVFVLLLEGTSAAGVSDGSTERHENSSLPGCDSKAHLVALSPNDLFSALWVDSFRMSIDAATEKRRDCDDQMLYSLASDPLPEAFEVLDGPVIIHRPRATPGEPWLGLEVFRRSRRRVHDSGPSSWRGQRLVVTPPGQPSKTSDVDMDRDSPEQEAPAVQGANAGVRSCASAPLLACPQAHNSEVATAAPATSRRGVSCRGAGSERMGDAASPVLALPSPAESAEAVPSLEPTWASLSLRSNGPASLSPWRGPLSGSRRTFTCLCRGPSADLGAVGLADATSGVDVGDGLVLRPLPPPFYLGSTEPGSDDPQVSKSDGGELGALWELHGQALACARPLPAPPRAVCSAAVDDGQGVLVVLLADEVSTALVLARDGSEFPLVEEYQGVSTAFAGDFLGNGREQVVLLPAVGPEANSGAEGGGGGISAGAPSKAGIGVWEQTPALKALVKRALVTDCSSVWGNGQCLDSAVLSSAGPIRVGGGRANGFGGPGDGSVDTNSNADADGSEVYGRRKRPRADAAQGDAVGGHGGAGGSAARGGSDRLRQAEGGDSHRHERLSKVVSVLRHRVQAEEARLLRLRQARRGKVALLHASELMLACQAIDGGWGGSEGASGTRISGSLRRAFDAFGDGLVACFPEQASSGAPREPELDGQHTPRHELGCTVSEIRFHPPSRTLCVDATITNPPDVDGESQQARARAAVNLCLSVACASGRLNIRSGICPRLGPGQSATVRACVQVPPSALAHETMSPGGVASLFVSCSWCWERVHVREEGAPGKHAGLRSSVIFARVLVSPEDMLGIPKGGSGGVQFASESDAKSSRRAAHDHAGGDSGRGVPMKHIGLFDVGTRVDLLLRTVQPGLATALPQAIRALSCLSSLPGPWASGAEGYVGACSERAAEYTLRACDASGAAGVLVRAAANVLPDGVRASTDPASSDARALVTAVIRALLSEISALEAIARERRRAVASLPAEGNGKGRVAVLATLERYVDAQMRTDVLAAQLAARLVAAGSDRR